jgi:polysaccharide pyruvyl transferase WcaK-like protein
MSNADTTAVCTTSSSFAYLGWNGHDNLGDDAIHLALREQLCDFEFVDLPTDPLGAARNVLRPRARLRRSRVLLGGGTVIGRANWRLAVAAALRACNRGPAAMIGVGVEDPRFHGRRSFSRFGELARWRGLLGRFERVTVRGPQSAELLADVGIDATIVGDPALLLTPRPPRAGNAVVACLGYGDDIWGHDQRLVEREVGLALAHVRDAGADVRFVVANPADRATTAAAASWAGASDAAISCATTPQRFFELLDGAAVVVAERLHASVLAACAGVPFVSLEYQPKCRDFAESLDIPLPSMRTDRLRSAELAELIVATALDDRARSHLDASVGRLRSMLLREVDGLRRGPQRLAVTAPGVTAQANAHTMSIPQRCAES